jgi:glycyl-tRNA synthetase beta chain
MAETEDFLLEIGTEEMPSAPLMNAQKQLKTLVEKGLRQEGLAYGEVSTFSTPRRLTVMVKDMATATEEIHEVRRGPNAAIAFDKDGKPTKAAQGFARKFHLKPGELTVKEDTDGKTYVFAENFVPARRAIGILSTLSHDTIGGLTWPNYRSQRWGSETETFVRPIRWICALLGSEVVPVTYAGVTSGNTTQGHRVLGPGAHTVKEPSEYVEVLKRVGVMGERERRQVILDGIKKVEAGRNGAHVDTPKKVFDEVVNLCEWPTVLVGKFDEKFLKVPHEIICESMLTNQRYFPIYDRDGNLTREFVVVSNADPHVNETVIEGNERVVTARLDDAQFFYEEDLKHPLEYYVPKLKSVVFQEKLGTIYDKTNRMVKIAGACAREDEMSDDKMGMAKRAAYLAKADLVTQAVVEFTSQQGVMGGYYAKAAGEPDEVCTAIREHYRPRFAGDEIPSSAVGCCAAIADKLDTILGMFVIDEPPTGSSDPFAIRRSAIGVIQMLRQMPKVSLTGLISTGLDAYAEQGLEFDKAKVTGQVKKFFQGRLKTIAKDEEIDPDVIDAVAAVDIIDPSEFLARAKALESARNNEPEVVEDVATAFKRASHLADPKLGDQVDESMLTDPERALFDACESGEAKVKTSLDNHDYAGALSVLADLREPIDTFFDKVLVMDKNEQVKDNHLRLLNRFSNIFVDVADISCLSRTK